MRLLGVFLAVRLFALAQDTGQKSVATERAIEDASATTPSAPEHLVFTTDIRADDLMRREHPLPRTGKTFQGTVHFRAVVTKEGRMENLCFVSGSPLLVEAARRAAVQHEYKPVALDGKPIDVVAEIEVKVTLRL